MYAGRYPLADLDELIRQIRGKWARVVAPKADGELDDRQWDAELARDFAGHTVWNLGDGFNYSKCWTYDIVCAQGRYPYSGTYAEEQAFIRAMGGHYDGLLLKLSAVLPYYLLHLLRRNLSDYGRIEEAEIAPEAGLHADLLSRARRFAERNRFVELPRAHRHALVPGVELELAEPGTVTVYNCLFEDESNTILEILRDQRFRDGGGERG